MSTTPDDRRYLQSHEWHLRDGDTVTIGITQIAADELTDVTYVDLPKVGATVKAGTPFGVIESVKATSDLVSGVDGTVTQVNAQLQANPALVNTDPFTAGWMIKVKASNPGQVDQMLKASEYLQKSGH